MAELLASFDGNGAAQPTKPTRPAHVAEVAWHVPPVYLRVLVAVAVAAGVLLTWWLLSARPRTAEPEAVRMSSHSEHSEPASAGAGATSELVIDVEGKVKRPGIITLPRGSRVHEAIKKAGGPVDGADTSTVNLARVLVDGEQIVVGASQGGPDAAGGAAGAPALGMAGGRVSLSSATAEQLDALPGIGPVTADAIIAHRTSHGGFQRVEDLLDVHGIGEKTLADLKDKVAP
jgi:competence protein ComEA